MIIAVLDTETTGIDPYKGHCIVELAIVFLNGKSGKVIGTYDQRINPQRSIDAKAQEVHGISIEDLKHEPVWSDVAAKVHSLLEKADAWCAHNAKFDVSFLAVEFDRVGLEIPNRRIIDTTEYRWASADGKTPKLGELCWTLGVDYDADAAHSALYDTKILTACLLRAEKLGKVEF